MFECKSCDFLTKYHLNYERHRKTNKHLEMVKHKINNLEMMCNNLELKNNNLELENTILRMENENIILEEEIESIKNEYMFNFSNKVDTHKIIIENNKLYINDIEIIVRSKDLYISVSQICNIYNKNFNEWCKQDYVEDIMNNIAEMNNSSINCIIDDSESHINQWVCNELFIQFCQYISPKLSLYVNKFITVLILNSKESSK